MRLAFARFRRRTLGGLPAPDVVLALVMSTIAVVSVLTGNPAEGPLAVTLPVAIASTLALVWRRRMPVLTVAVIVVAGFVQTLLADSPGSLWSLAVYAIAMYSLAAWSSEAVAAIAGAVFVAALLIQERLDSGVDYVFILLLFGGVWLLGRASRHWRTRVSSAERREREAARLAAAEERLRIARDLHDVLAHTLGAIAVQADAADAALQVAPERAVEPVRAIRDTARAALAEIRDVLDVLRTEEDERTAVTRSQAPAITALVEAARAAGMTVEVELQLSGATLPAPIDLACYRIVQEGLTNARKHAAGAAVSVSVVQRDETLTVEIVDRGGSGAGAPRNGDGHGLQGMRERARELGGTVTAEATADGGFRVIATLPIHDAAATEGTP